MTEDTDNKIASAGKLLRLLDPIRRWRSTWQKLVVVMLVTFVFGFPAAIVSTNIAFAVLGVPGLVFSLPIAFAGVITLPAIVMSYCTHKPDQGQWKWNWTSIGKWSLATPCILFICFIVAITVQVIHDKARVEEQRSTQYSTLIERTISESEAVNNQRSPVKLIQFRPAAIDREHRIRLFFNAPYEIRRTSDSSQSGVFFPTAELRLLTATGSIIRTTNTVDPISFRAMSGEFRPEMKEGLRSEMTLEFTPRDLNDYSVEFIGPPKGFAEYRVVIEAQGIE